MDALQQCLQECDAILEELHTNLICAKQRMNLVGRLIWMLVTGFCETLALAIVGKEVQ